MTSEQLLQDMERAITDRAVTFQNISDAIWDAAELGFTEEVSAKLLTEALEKEGFTVQRGISGMPTAFIASYTHGTGGPNIGFLGEYDALPELSQRAGATTPDPLVLGAPGHACGHNAMGSMQALTVCAVKELVERHNLSVTLTIFGTPAEEMLACKGFMARDGHFDNLDAVIDCHANAFFGTSFGIENNGLFSFLVEFTGRTAHAGSRPWTGRSAADAVELFHAGTERMREHILPEQRIHWVTLQTASAPNVVPESGRTWYYIRSQDLYIKDLFNRVLKCAQGAALMTETKERVIFLAACHQRYNNEALARALFANMKRVGVPSYTDEEQAFAKALQQTLDEPQVGMDVAMTLTDAAKVPPKGDSSDVGDVTLKAPTATLQFPTWVPHAKAHTWSVTACQRSSITHKGIVAGAKVASFTVLDMLLDPKLLPAMRAEFEAMRAEHKYEQYLADDAIPPIKWNSVEMARFRPLLAEALKE